VVQGARELHGKGNDRNLRICGNPARMDADAAGMERGVKRLSAGM